MPEAGLQGGENGAGQQTSSGLKAVRPPRGGVSGPVPMGTMSQLYVVSWLLSGISVSLLEILLFYLSLLQ